MLNKNYISEKVKEILPDLNRIRFTLDGTSVSDFSEKTLYPFMIYQNTVDSYNRLITIYLPENSHASFLTPFISAIGTYRNALNKVMREHNFKVERFGSQCKQIVFNGDVCSIVLIDYIHRILVIRTGKGNEVDIKFRDSYEIKWSYRNALDIKTKIDELKKIDIIDRNDIFTFPLIPDKTHFKGILLFTNVTKFEALLRNIKVSNSDIREYLNIQKTIFTSDGESIKLASISLSNTHNKPIILVVSRSDSFQAFQNIIDAGRGSLNHVNTIIIDDFDDIILKAKKNGTLESDLALMQSDYFERLGKGIKDIYLICKNKNFAIQDIFKNNKINSFPWLITPKEALFIDNIQWTNPEIQISRISDRNYEDILEEIDNYIFKWRELAKTNFCNGKILIPIKLLYDLREKWNSFYEPDNLNTLLSGLKGELDQMQQLWFLNKTDYGLIKETKEFCRKVNNQSNTNYKTQDIKKVIENLDNNIKSVKIIARNSDEIDHDYILKYLSQINPELIYEIENIKNISGNQQKNKSADLAIFLTWSKDSFNSSCINPIANKQLYLINKTGFDFIKSYSTQVKNKLLDIGSTGNKYKLLNISPPDENTTTEEELIPLKFIEYHKEPDINPELSGEEQLIPDIVDVVQNIIIEHNKSFSLSHVAAKTYSIFFEDGSHVEWPEYRNVFYYDETVDSEDVSVQKNITDLKIGDQIIVAKRSKELRHVMEESLNQNASFSKSIKYDNEWRRKLLHFIQFKGWDIQYFRSKLRENGFRIETNYTISNWIEGDTIKPLNFSQLLDTLSKMGILENSRIRFYHEENKKLKSIKIKFIRRSVQKLLLSMKGINYGTDDLFDEELLNTFIDHIEMKRVLGILKN